MDAVQNYLREQAYRLRDLDSHSVDATMLEAASARIAELETRIERARKQLAVSDQYAADERGSSRVPSVWELQNSLVRDALADK